MAFEIPPPKFDAYEHARNKAIRSNQFLELVLQQFTDAYESFWGVSGSTQPINDDDGNPTDKTEFVGGGSRYTTEEMQSVIDALGPQALVAILTQTAGFTQFLNAAYPGVLADRYQKAAFDYKMDETGIHLVGLNEIWAKKEDEK